MSLTLTETRYIEAIGVLYTCNTFSMRRAKSLSLLPKVILPHRLQLIRNIHFSTAFACPIRPDFSYKHLRFPPDYIAHWPEACHALASMRGLKDLHITLAIWPRIPGKMDTIDDDSVYFLLDPLKIISAEKFNVVITVNLSDAVKARLGSVPFVLSKRVKHGIGFYTVHADD
ncbi:hypothetical protein MPH_07292 [Macrophomina phaseolina MS6]|uniref:DUF7730 domain-containing protein n=1 Tax=Macrophomina phaseolina (strain MS6) TaxID=1126212 RepID=K2SF85_MACPH|nr:hypothetical protein MPH_07292 [Macrophomina phaseolina MS6]